MGSPVAVICKAIVSFGFGVLVLCAGAACSRQGGEVAAFGPEGLDYQADEFSHLNDVDGSGEFVFGQRSAAEKAADLLDQLADEGLMSQLDRLSLQELEAVFGIVEYGALFVLNGGVGRDAELRAVGRLEKVVAAIATHRPLQDREIEGIYKARIQMRDFASANEWYRSHLGSGLEPLFGDWLEPVRVEGQPHYWRFDESRHRWEHRSFLPPEAGLVVIVATPNCEYSRELAQKIEADPELEALLRDRSLWLASPYQQVTSAALSGWSRQHPQFPVALMDRREGWSFIDEIRVSPWIYWVKDGKARHFDDFDEILRGLLKRDAGDTAPIPTDAD